MIEVVFKDGRSVLFEGDKWGMSETVLGPGRALILATDKEEVTAQVQWDEVRSIAKKVWSNEKPVRIQ